MDDIVNQINALGSRIDDEGRVILVQTLDELLCKFESPFSSLRRYGNGVRTVSSKLQFTLD